MGGDLRAIQRRSKGVHLQLILVVMLLMVFLRNTFCSIKLLVKSPRKLAHWGCFISTFAGIVYLCCFALPHHLPGGPSCNKVIWGAVSGLCVSTMSTNSILLERAYLANQRNKWFLLAGILLIVPAPMLLVVTYLHVTPTFNPSSGCYITFNVLFPYFRLLIDLPPNMVFSAAFSIVIYRQYKRFGDRCWKRLAREGMVTMVFVVMSNFTCMVCNVLNVFGEATDVLFIVDWWITTTLLVESTRRIYSSRRRATTTTRDSSSTALRTQDIRGSIEQSTVSIPAEGT
ncbi:hypothetical protein SYNPS1DRAFT_26815 [Syncephalis pseudoplumigaleata]|uniref:Uncharacterized protein n=1 Tax=Syncephalis pseudoplumigaleata TaxID=1712513 RepID=A0A4P9Z4M4_9FUNG|nr:hypothetical protein SYNPS1DRAFT_26815 [Syncephalis pseudoplumigaleata]|eukprot:RKP27534.1 hypothetical protein SYNPS1DRAFT_26815 [Syncephalis pseudoplumigaleata]